MVVSGDDPVTLPMIAAGADGLVSVVANAYPKEISEMINLTIQGDLIKATLLHYNLLELMNAMFEEGNPSGIKAMLDILKIAQNNVRLPLTPVSDKHYEKLQYLSKKIR